MLLLPPPNKDTAQPSRTTIKIITMAIQPPAIRAVIRAFVPAIIALTAAMVALTDAFVASAVAFAVALAACAAFWVALTDAFAAACAVLAVCSVVLIAALEVACAVLTVLSVVLTVPFAVYFRKGLFFNRQCLTKYICRIIKYSHFIINQGKII